MNKTVLSPGTYILGRQTVHVDQRRYLDYIERREGEAFCYMSDRQICQYVASLQPGTAIVRLSTGEQRIVKFYERTSQHISHTPKVQAALNRYSSIQFSSDDMSFGADIGGDDEDLPPAAQTVAVDFDASLSGVERVRRLLQQNGNLRVCELARIAKVEPSTASRTRTKFFESRN